VTNLSELLPSGGGAKEFDAVASGTLPNGQTVILKADGKVEAVGIGSQEIGSTQNWSGTDQVNAFLAGVYDDAQQRVIIAFTETSPSYYYGQLIAGEVDAANNSITFGTASIYNTTFGIGHTLGYDSTNNKAVVFFQDVSQSSHGKARVASISGSTITFPGSNATYNSASTEDTVVTFSSDLGSFLICYKNNSNSAFPTGIVGTVSGNNISFGNAVALDNKNASYLAVVWDSTTSYSGYQYFLLFYQNNTGTQFRYQYVIVTGATQVNAGTPNLIELNGSFTAQALNTKAVYDSVNQKVYLATINGQNNSYASALVATSNGSTLTFGTENFFAGNSTAYGLGLAWDSSAERLVISYLNSSQFGKIIAGSVSGTTLTFGSPESFRNDITSNLATFYDSGAKRVVTAYTNQVTNDYTGNSVVFQPESSNVSDFIGITSEAIANTATGKVNPQGGVATASSPSSGEAGTAVVFTGNIASSDAVAVFDSGSNQVVIGFQNASTGGGQAIVADLTASTNAVTLGSAGSYQAAGGASYNAITYDASANKIVSICSALASPFQGVAYVGTVSGTSISYTGAVNFNGTENYQAGDLTYDSSNNVTVVSFERNDAGSNKHGAAVVGTISGGAITFGTVSDFAPSINIKYPNNTFDSNSNKVVTVFENSNTGYGNAVVSTVSGTTISHGSISVLATNGTEMGQGGTICFDSTNNKVIAPYRNTTDSKGYVKIGTVSGTAITFGNAVEFDAAPGGQSIRSVYDSNLNKVIIFYTDSSNYPTVRTGTVSGTSIVLDDAFTVATTTVTDDMSCAAAFDSSENRTLLSYKPSTTGLGNAQVYLTSGTAQDLIVGSTYYVQNNGNLSTTSSTVTAGKAISTTQLILNGAS